MWRFILRIVLIFVIYNVTIDAVSALADGMALFLARSGSPEPWRILHRYLFWKWIAVGFLAGLVPLEFLFSAARLFKSRILGYLNGLGLEGMKRWVVVLCSPVVIMGLLDWAHDLFALRSRLANGLTNSPSMQVSRMFEGFFSTSCRNVSDFRLELWGDNFGYRCAVHVLQLTIFFTGAAYSLAPWVRKQFLKRVAIHHPDPLDLTPDEDELHKSANGDHRNE